MGFGTLGLVGGVSLGGVLPPWVLNQSSPPAIDMDFVHANYYGALIANVVCTRSTTGYADDVNGLYTSFAINTPRITSKGLLIEGIRTNSTLWNRDLTNVAWTPTTMTAAKDQTGVDGVASSASSILATGANATIIQTMTTGAGTARWQTAFVKRLVGVGTVNMTMDNGATWTAVTVTSAWTRVSIPTQTPGGNPQVGFQIVTSGDQIAVDFVQNEDSGFFATSPIATTTVAVARSADAVIISTPPAFSPTLSFYVQATCLAPIPNTSGSAAYLTALSDGTANNRVYLYRDKTDGKIDYNATVGGVAKGLNGSVAAVNPNVSMKAALAVADVSQALSLNGAAAVTSSWTPMVSGISKISLASNEAGTQQGNCYLERVAYWPTARLANATLVTITT